MKIIQFSLIKECVNLTICPRCKTLNANQVKGLQNITLNIVQIKKRKKKNNANLLPSIYSNMKAKNDYLQQEYNKDQELPKINKFRKM